MKKIKDLVVTTGKYTKDGQEKNRYVNVGAIMEKDDGGKFMFLNRHFNPAGVPFKEGSESIIVSMFDVDGDNSRPVQEKPAESVDDDEVPF